MAANRLAPFARIILRKRTDLGALICFGKTLADTGTEDEGIAFLNASLVAFVIVRFDALIPKSIVTLRLFKAFRVRSTGAPRVCCQDTVC